MLKPPKVKSQLVLNKYTYAHEMGLRYSVIKLFIEKKKNCLYTSVTCSWRINNFIIIFEVSL